MRIVIILLLCLLLLSGFWLASRGEVETSMGAPDQTRHVVEEVSSADLVGAPGRVARVEERSEVGHRADHEPTTADPREVTGRVVDSYGRPVSGTEVLLIDRERAFGMDLEGGAEPLGRVGTDSKGAFSIDLGESPVGHPLTLKVREPGFAPLDHSFSPDGRHRQAVGDLALDPGVVLSGVVLDPSGSVVDGAQIKYEERSTSLDLIWSLAGSRAEVLDETGSDGRFEIKSQAAGPWSFRVTHPHFPDLVVTGELPDPGAVEADLRWVFTPGASISGVLEGAPGGSVAGITVVAWPLGRAGLFDMEQARERRSSPLSPDRTFEVGGLAPRQQYRVEAQRSRGEQRLPASVSDSREAAAGTDDLTLTWAESALVRFGVLDAVTGAPIEVLGVRFGAGFQSPLTGPDGAPRRTFAGGVVEVPGLRPLPGASSFEVSLAAPGYALHSLSVEVRPGEQRDLGSIALTPVSSLMVTVQGQDSSPVAEASVLLRVVKEASSEVSTRIQMGERSDPERMAFPGEIGSHHAYTDSSGLVRLSSLPGEAVELVVRATGFAPTITPAFFLPATGDEQRLVQLMRGAAVRIRTLDAGGTPAPGRAIEHRRPVSLELVQAARPRRSGGDGYALFEYLEVGTHWFRIEEQAGVPTAMSMTTVRPGGAPMGEGWASLDVLPGGEYELELYLTPRGRLHGRVTEGGEVLAGASVTLERESKMALPMLPGSGPSSSTSSRGLYSLDDVRVGSYVLVVEHPSRALSSRIPVELEAEEQELDLDLPRCSVAGRVVDEAGEPLAGARVTGRRAEKGGGQESVVVVGMSGGGGLEVFSASTGAEGSTGVISDADGRYTLEGLPAGESLQVEARLSGRQPTRSDAFELEVGEQRGGVDLELPAAGLLRVTVDLPKIASPMMVMALYTGDGANPGPKIARHDGEDVLFEDLLAGTWSVRLQVLGPPAEGEEIPEPQSIEVIAGQETLVEFRP